MFLVEDPPEIFRSPEMALVAQVRLANLMEESKRTTAFWDATLIVAAKLIQSGNLPDELRPWVADVLMDLLAERDQKSRPRPSRPGPNPDLTHFRNAALVEALLHVTEGAEFRLRPTRGDAKKAYQFSSETEAADPALCCREGGSACDVVGVAWNRMGLGPEVKYKTMENLWRRHKNGENFWDDYLSNPPVRS